MADPISSRGAIRWTRVIVLIHGCGLYQHLSVLYYINHPLISNKIVAFIATARRLPAPNRFLRRPPLGCAFLSSKTPFVVRFADLRRPMASFCWLRVPELSASAFHVALGCGSARPRRGGGRTAGRRGGNSSLSGLERTPGHLEAAPSGAKVAWFKDPDGKPSIFRYHPA